MVDRTEFTLLRSSCLKCEPLGLALRPAPEICLGKGAYWYMANKSERFCLMATHLWINQRVVSSSYFEDVPKGLPLGSKRRKDDTSREKLMPQEERHKEGSTLSESNCSAPAAIHQESHWSLLCTSAAQEYLLLSGMFLPLKKESTYFSIWHYLSCSFPISTGDFVQSVFQIIKARVGFYFYFHWFLEFRDPSLGYNNATKRFQEFCLCFL